MATAVDASRRWQKRDPACTVHMCQQGHWKQPARTHQKSQQIENSLASNARVCNCKVELTANARAVAGCTLKESDIIQCKEEKMLGRKGHVDVLGISAPEACREMLAF